MIKSSQNFLTLRLRNLPSYLKLVCISLFIVSCSGKPIHPEINSNPEVLTRKWTRSFGSFFDLSERGTEYSNPVLFENSIIFGTEKEGLLSIYSDLNQERWKLSIKGGISSELAIYQDSVFFAGGDGYFYSVKVETGQINWKIETKNDVASKAAYFDGRIFFTTSNDVIYALDAGTGKLLWQYQRKTFPKSSIRGASSPLIDGNTVYAGLSDGYLVALSLEEGQQKWEKKLHQGIKFTDVDAHPVIQDGILYISSYDGALYALKLNSSGADLIWRFDAGGSKEIIIEDQRLFLPSSDGSLYALQKSNGKVLWKFDLEQGTPTQITVVDQFLIFGSSHRSLFVIDRNTESENGKPKAIYRFDVGSESGFSGSFAYDEHTRRLYALSGAGNLYAFEVKVPRKKMRPYGSIGAFSFQSL